MRFTKFTGVLLSVFVLIILAVAVVNFIAARQTSATDACVNNLRVIDAAKQQWALEHGKTWDDVRPYLGRFPSNSIPVCPEGGTYTLGRVGSPPTCSIGGPRHSLSQ
jgi:hypothetical protein